MAMNASVRFLLEIGVPQIDLQLKGVVARLRDGLAASVASVMLPPAENGLFPVVKN